MGVQGPSTELTVSGMGVLGGLKMGNRRQHSRLGLDHPGSARKGVQGVGDTPK